MRRSFRCKGEEGEEGVVARVSFGKVAAHPRIEEEEPREVDDGKVVGTREVMGCGLEVCSDGRERVWDGDVCWGCSVVVVAGLEEGDDGGYHGFVGAA